MKRFLIISIILLLNSLVYSQSITWQKVYKGPSWSDCYGSGICNADSDNFFIISTNDYPRGIYVIKINSYGDTLWTKFIENGEGYSSVSSGDGGCVITGLWQNSPTITYSLKLNSNGNVIWQKLYNNSQTAFCNSIMKTIDNKYIACGKVGYDDGYILKIDSSGNMIWQKSYSSSDEKTYRAVIETNDSCYIVSGSVTDNPYESGKGVLTKIDTSGNIIWEKRYNTYKYAMSNIFAINKFNENYLITGHAYDTTTTKWGICFMRLDLQGNVLFTKFYEPFNDGYYWEPDSKIINSNKYLISYNRFGSSVLDSIIANVMITDSLGNIISHKEFISTDYTYIRHSLLIDNNDILFIGNSNHINPDFENLYVVRTDSNLYAPPIGINNIGSINPDDYKLYQNYPNPFNPSTQIHFDLHKSSYTKLIVYNILGKEIIKLVDEKLDAGCYEVDFDASAYPSGVYFYRLVTDEFSDVKKMILIK